MTPWRDEALHLRNVVGLSYLRISKTLSARGYTKCGHPRVAAALRNAGGVARVARRRRSGQIGAIVNSVAETFGVSPDAILGQSRAANIVVPRHIAMGLARELTGMSLPAIGRRFCGRDHTTILHGVRRAAQLVESDQLCRVAWDRAREAFGAHITYWGA